MAAAIGERLAKGFRMAIQFGPQGVAIDSNHTQTSSQLAAEIALARTRHSNHHDQHSFLQQMSQGGTPEPPVGLLGFHLPAILTQGSVTSCYLLPVLFIITEVKYDCLILLGTQPDLETWEFPRQIHKCVQKTAELYEAGIAENIIASGKWSRRIEDQSLGQPFDECDKSADLLIAAGVRNEAISRERVSTDTISNLYYVKTQFLIPKQWSKLLFVVADFRIPRLRFLVSKVLGPEYQVDYEPIATSGGGPSYNETRTMERTKAFLARMDEGDHEWLADKFFADPFYTRLAEKHARQK